MRAVDRLIVGLDVECRLKATELRQTGRRSLNEGRIIDGGRNFGIAGGKSATGYQLELFLR